ncbi:MAG: Holliday junction resolvase RuvX [Patescibacteria group bacterium]
MRYLGIDYGSKRIGVALSDAEGDFSYPKEVVKNDKYALDHITRLCTKEEVGGIVMGESRDYKGIENPIMKKARAFAAALAEKTTLPVHFELEFLTSAEALRIQDPGSLLDASAAALILKSFLGRNAKK